MKILKQAGLTTILILSPIANSMAVDAPPVDTSTPSTTTSIATADAQVENQSGRAVIHDNGLYVDLNREIELAKQEQSASNNIKALNEELKVRIDELNSLKTSLSSEVTQQGLKNENLKLVVTLYESISAEQAAELLKRMPYSVSVTMLQMMSPKKSSKILAAMDPKMAVEISRHIIQQKPVATSGE